MNRDSVMGWIREAFGFGKILSSTLSETTNTVGVKAVGANETEASADDEDFWSHAPLLYRPQDPDASGHCEPLFYRLGDGKVVFATKDRRYQIAIEKGEVAVTAMGPGTPAYVLLKPDGSAIVRASTINLGGDATNFVALANLVQTQLTTLKSAISGAATTANDGGAAFKTNILAALSAWPGSVAAAKTKAK